MNPELMDKLIMNAKEREQVKIFEQVKQGLITQVEASARLKISDRWVRKKIKRYYEDGDSGLIHKNRGKVSPRQWDDKERQLLLGLLKSEWHGFGPTFAAEKLKEIYNISISREVVRKTMIKECIWKVKQKRSKHRKWRERKTMLGIMIQLDGSPHDWFEGRGAPCVLLVFIDDATSKILWLEFVTAEAVIPVMRATKSYIEKWGIPQSFYTDYGSVFHVNRNNDENIKKTQWERACEQLSITVIHASSPQAKGRVERCNQTMQDRLIKELRLAKVSSIQAANEYLRDSNFIEKHNTKYAVKPSQQGDAHADANEYDLDDIFTIRARRILMNDFTILYRKRIFQLHKQQKAIIRPKHEIIIKTLLTGEISLWIRNIKLNFNEIGSRPEKEIVDKKIINKIIRPGENSRRWVMGLPPLSSRVKPAQPDVEVFNK